MQGLQTPSIIFTPFIINDVFVVYAIYKILPEIKLRENSIVSWGIGQTGMPLDRLYLNTAAWRNIFSGLSGLGV